MRVSFLHTWILYSLLSVAAEANERPSEYSVKAAYLYQLSKFINWPSLDPATNNSLHLCTFESDPFRGALQKIHLRKVQGREIHIHYVNDDIHLSSCHILFIHDKISNNFIKKKYKMLSKNNILTIGEKTGFAQNGGIIGFTLEDNRIGVEINIKAAKDAGIGVSANLIEIASKVYYQRQS
jgi:hypothetical protein